MNLHVIGSILRERMVTQVLGATPWSDLVGSTCLIDSDLCELLEELTRWSISHEDMLLRRAAVTIKSDDDNRHEEEEADESREYDCEINKLINLACEELRILWERFEVGCDLMEDKKQEESIHNPHLEVHDEVDDRWVGDGSIELTVDEIG
jgi:hypothetical protein